MDRRVLPGLLLGLGGLAFGVGAVVFDVPALAAGAAVLALGAALASAQMLRWLRQAEGQAITATALTSMRDVQLAAEHGARHVVDRETGLPDARFFELAVEGRVALARRHLWPVTVVLVELDLGPDGMSHATRAEALGQFADLMRQTLREADVMCRIGPASFALLLEDTSEEGGVWTAERLQIAMAREGSRARRLAAGVASYPTHGLHTTDILGRARAALARACAAEAGHGLGQVEVASADLG